MVFSIKSYTPPEAMYNIIYRIEIKDISFFDEVYLKKDEFFLKNWYLKIALTTGTYSNW